MKIQMQVLASHEQSKTIKKVMLQVMNINITNKDQVIFDKEPDVSKCRIHST